MWWATPGSRSCVHDLPETLRGLAFTAELRAAKHDTLLSARPGMRCKRFELHHHGIENVCPGWPSTGVVV